MADRRRSAVLPAVCAGVLAALTVGFAVMVPLGWRDLVETYALTNLVIGLGFVVSSTMIAWHRSRHVIGRLFAICGLGHLASAAATTVGWYAVGAGWPLAVVRVLATVAGAAWQLGLPGLFPLVLLLFPDGRLPGRWWKPLAWLVLLNGAYQLGTSLLATTTFAGSPAATSILDIGLAPSAFVELAAVMVNATMWLFVIASLVLRYGRGGEQIRRQLLWLILALIAMLLLNTQRWISGEGPILLLLSFVLIPIAVGVAIVRYELFDIRLVLSRTLLYGLTLAVIISGYAGLVASLSLLVPRGADRSVTIVAAITVAIVFTPVRLTLLRLLDRAFYGLRADPAEAASTVAEQFRDADDLGSILHHTRATLRLPSLALRRDPAGEIVALAGDLGHAIVVDIALSYRGERVGVLQVALRKGETRLHEADRRTLDLIATPLAVALHATALTEQVQRARVKTVEAGATERLRLQRELHDGLGPTLTSIAFRADAVSNVIHNDTGTAIKLLTEVRRDLRSALDSIRRIVYGLRPIELESLGLVGALSERVTAIPSAEPNPVAGFEDCRPTIRLDTPTSLPDLSPAVELAGYRIVVEALTNVLRHADATSCTVRITADNDLVVSVDDDGTPPDTWTAGVGLTSIRDRAEEVGGTASAGPTPHGWRVVARLPLVSP